MLWRRRRRRRLYSFSVYNNLRYLSHLSVYPQDSKTNPLIPIYKKKAGNLFLFLGCWGRCRKKPFLFSLQQPVNTTYNNYEACRALTRAVSSLTWFLKRSGLQKKSTKTLLWSASSCEWCFTICVSSILFISANLLWLL